MLNILILATVGFFKQTISRDVITKSQATGYAQLCLSIAIFMLIPAIVVQLSIMQRFSQNGTYQLTDELIATIRTIPTITYHSGSIQTPESKSYLIESAESGNDFLLIDTTKPMDELTKNNSEPLFIMNKDELSVHTYQEYRQIIKVKDLGRALRFPDDKAVIISANDILQAAEEITANLNSAGIIFYFSVGISQLAEFALRVLVYAFIGMMIGGWLGIILSFKTALRLACLTATPLIIIDALGMAIGQQIFVFRALVYFIIQNGLMYWHLKYLRQNPA